MADPAKLWLIDKTIVEIKVAASMEFKVIFLTKNPDINANQVKGMGALKLS